MDLLIIGGTRFVGRHLVDAALARGDRITLFNRGQSAPPSAPMPTGVTVLRGDRQGDLSALAGGRRDAVIDTCACLPADADRMAGHLAHRVGRYALISSVSVYASAALPNTEDAALGGIDDTDTTVVDGRTYGDLAAFVLHALDACASGAFNAAAPPGFTTMAGLLQACGDAAGVAARLHGITDADLLAQGVRPWVDLPLWLPADAEHAAFMAVPTDRAQTLGLMVRPLADTVADTLAWWRALPAESQAFALAGLPG
jgi:nucleoside-diphosphate-sugar epimerase